MLSAAWDRADALDHDTALNCADSITASAADNSERTSAMRVRSCDRVVRGSSAVSSV